MVSTPGFWRHAELLTFGERRGGHAPLRREWLWPPAGVMPGVRALRRAKRPARRTRAHDPLGETMQRACTGAGTAAAAPQAPAQGPDSALGAPWQPLWPQSAPAPLATPS